MERSGIRPQVSLFLLRHPLQIDGVSANGGEHLGGHGQRAVPDEERGAAADAQPTARHRPLRENALIRSSNFEKKKSDTFFFDFAACSFCQILSLCYMCFLYGY